MVQNTPIIESELVWKNTPHNNKPNCPSARCFCMFGHIEHILMRQSLIILNTSDGHMAFI